MNRTFRPDPNGATWHRSSYSNQAGGDCVEVALGCQVTVPVRDSKAPHGPALVFGTDSWSAFLHEVKASRRRP
ncbi:DUF397 domain-containing protein [Streptomyces sp. NPDC088812]|uniref:DUF397 domain-containing protein n=1 Tax=Streptomyces sp. NPDC088812 TaxID=3365905 RepID=UPI00380B51D9